MALMIDHATRLVAYAPLGDRLGVLPDPLSFSATTPHATEDRGALSLTYSKLARRGDILGRRLTDGLEVALEEHDGTAWVEVTNGRFVVAKTTSDRTDKTDTLSLEAPHFSWLLTKIKHAAPDEALYASEGQNEGRRQFIGVNAGIVIATLLQEYVDRGGPTIQRGFTTSVDSNGNVWPSLNAFWVSRGEALDVTISRLAAGGAVDVWWDGRTMHAAPMQSGRDRSSEVILREGMHVSAAPSEETIADLITTHTVHGGEGLLVTDVEPSAPSPWGRWEGFASDDRITTEAGARSRNQSELADAGRLRGQYTRDLTPLCPWRVGSDIRAGDWITAPTHTARERVRVASLLWRMDSQGTTRSLILNDSLLSAELARLRKQRLGESGSSGEGSGVRVTPEGPDKRTPAQVTGLTLATQAYLDPDGAARGLIVGQWAPVTTARPEDGGGALEVERYEIATRLNAQGAPWGIILSTQELSAEWGNLDPGSEVVVRVRARGKYATAPGVWSAPQVITVADDTTPPPVPSDLVASSSNGVATWTWDGLTHQGQPQPLDFSHMDVEWEGVHEGTNVAGVDSMRGPGRVHVPLLDRGSVARARGKSVDRSGNTSGWSAWVTVTIASVLDDTDLDDVLTEHRQSMDSLGDDVAEVRDEIIPPLQTAITAANTQLTEHEQSLQDQHNDLTELRQTAATGWVVEYAVGTSETSAPATGWSTTQPVRTPGSFIWMRSRVTYGNGTTANTAPALVTGNQGPKGDDGTSVQISGRVADQAALPTNLGPTDAGKGWITENDGHLHVWSGTDWTDVGVIRGPQGDDGVSIVGVSTYYRRSATAPGTPSGSPPGDGWTVTEPGYIYGLTLYRTEQVLFSDGSVSYTVPTRVSADTLAGAALEARKGFATYEWTGTPHLSASIEKVNGVETRRNHVPNPSFEVDLAGWSALGGSTLARGLPTSPAPAVGAGIGSFNVPANGIPTVDRLLLQTRIDHAGGWVGVAVWVRSNVRAEYIQLRVHGSTSGWQIGQITPIDGTWQRVSAAFQMPADSVTMSVLIPNHPTDVTVTRAQSTQAWLDGVTLVSGTTRAAVDAALDLGYFDGDTPGGAGAQHLEQLDQELGEVRLSANRRNQVIHNLLPPFGEVHPDTGEPLTVGDVWWQVDTLAGSGRVTIGQWGWDGNGWRSATIGHEVINSVDVNDLNVYGTAQMNTAVIDKLWADGLFAKTGLFNRAIISSTDNILPGVDDLRSVNSTTGMTPADVGFGASGFGINTSDPSFWVRGQASPETNIPFHLQAGTTYRVSVDSRSTVNNTRFYWQFVAQSGQDLTAGGSTSYVFSNTLTGTGWRTHTTEYTPAESGLVTLKVYANHSNGADNPDGYQWFRNARIMPMTGTTHIENGAITTNLVGANQITGNEIYFDEAFGNKIAAGIAEFDNAFIGFVKSDMIDTYALDFKQATGLEITSGVFRTTPQANRGVIIDTGGLRAYNTSGALTAQITGNSGSVLGWTITGSTVRTASAGARVQLTDAIRVFDSSRERIYLGTADGGRIDFKDNNGRTRMALTSASGMLEFNDSAGRNAMRLDAGIENDYPKAQLVGPSFGNWRPYVEMGVRPMEGTTSRYVQISAYGPDSAQMVLHGAGAWSLGSGTRGRIYMTNTSGAIQIQSRTAVVNIQDNVNPLPLTSGLQWSLGIIQGASTGWHSLYRVTSVREQKLDIQDLADPGRVLDLPVRTWIDRSEWEQYTKSREADDLREEGRDITATDGNTWTSPTPPRRIPGLIFDEVEDVAPEFVVYDPDGNPASVAYDRVALALIPVVRDLRDRLNRLETP